MFDETFTPSERSKRPQLTCNMTNEQWLDAISCPRIDPINPNTRFMSTRQEQDDLSSTDSSDYVVDIDEQIDLTARGEGESEVEEGSI